MTLAWLRISLCCLIVGCLAKVKHVENLDYEPRVGLFQGRHPVFVNVDTGAWTDDKEEFFSTDPKEILKYCQKTYPNIEITNIVEANENVTVCSGENCKTSVTFLPYRCLVGEFEADALSYPPDAQCDFGYVHEAKTCKNHAYWHDRGNVICKNKGKHLAKFSILVPCGTDLFTGVEYVCCKKSITTAAPTAEAVEPTTKPKTKEEELQGFLDHFAARIPDHSKGCDLSMYETKSDLLRMEKEGKVKKLTKNLNEAKLRKKELQNDDPEQAKSFFDNTLQIFKNMLKNIESQAKLDNSQLNQERKECAQMVLNHKKHAAMKAFVDAVRRHRNKPGKIIKTFQRLMHVLQNDQSKNMRDLSRMVSARGSKKLMALRDVFLGHLKVVKSILKEAVEILRRVESVQGQMDFDLPAFAGDIDFEFAHKQKTTPAPPTHGEHHIKEPLTEVADGTLGLDKDESSPENEHEKHRHKYPHKNPHKPGNKEKMHGQKHKDHPLKSKAVFAAVIGLSCGALVIMIVIVLALFFRKGSTKRSTKTVIADDDNQEKRHLLKMQEDGFENPTYKFFAH